MSDSATLPSPFFQGVKVIFFSLIPAVAILAAVVGLSREKVIPLSSLTRDLAAVADVPQYTGMLSIIGIFAWSAAVGICAFCSVLLYICSREEPLKEIKIYSRVSIFFLLSAMLTAILLVDDAFMVHEYASYQFGIPNAAFVAFYGFFTIYILLRYNDLVRMVGFPIFMFAAGCLGMSAVVDQLADLGILHSHQIEKEARLFIEDAFK